MRGHPDEIDHALATLCGSVADGLSTAGWNRRTFDEDRTRATLTRPTQNGVMAVVTIFRTSFQWPDDWPVEVLASLGVGYEPALDLMPLLTLDPRATLITDPEPGRQISCTVPVDGLDTVADAAQQIIQSVDEHAATITANFPDAAAIDAHLQRAIDSALTKSDGDTGDVDHDPRDSDFDTQLRLVVLAAMGRHETARTVLATYPATPTGARIDRADRRFIRQLTRWLDAGGPAVPPVEDTLAQLPRPARSPRPSWAGAWARIGLPIPRSSAGTGTPAWRSMTKPTTGWNASEPKHHDGSGRWC